MNVRSVKVDHPTRDRTGPDSPQEDVMQYYHPSTMPDMIIRVTGIQVHRDSLQCRVNGDLSLEAC